MEITAELVKTLRIKTDAGMMDCKKALKETGGDLEAAVAYLRQKGLAVASKRADRTTSEGMVWASIAPDQKSGLLLEVNCETDFVAKTPAFVELGTRLTEHLAAVALESVEELLTQPCPHQPDLSVTDYLNEVIAKTGEAIRIRHFTRYQGDLVTAYIHHGGKIGVMLELSGGGTAPEAVAAAKDLAMQVAATCLWPWAGRKFRRSSSPRKRPSTQAAAKESGKPDKIIEKMVIGRLEKFYKEVCLVEQTFVKNPDITVTQFLKEVGATLGGKEPQGQTVHPLPGGRLSEGRMASAPVKYRRILLKVSGESLAGEKKFGLDPATLRAIAGEIKGVVDLKVEIGIVVGGGNIFRGLEASAQGIDRAVADNMGMLATVVNALALQDALEKAGVPTRVMSAITMNEVAEPYIRRRAMRHLEKGRIVVFGAGTGSPYFTTDTAAALRATEIGAEAILKGTRVAGIYDRDPEKDAQAA